MTASKTYEVEMAQNAPTPSMRGQLASGVVTAGSRSRGADAEKAKGGRITPPKDHISGYSEDRAGEQSLAPSFNFPPTSTEARQRASAT